MFLTLTQQHIDDATGREPVYRALRDCFPAAGTVRITLDRQESVVDGIRFRNPLDLQHVLNRLDSGLPVYPSEFAFNAAYVPSVTA